MPGSHDGSVTSNQKNLAPSIALKFFSAIQRKFYVEGKDPKVTDFYADICASIGLDFAEFRNLFEYSEARQAVQEAFYVAANGV